ncbi:MAG: hypothetical protein LKF54_00025 [Bacilli bacterium]|jgi:hypothetical protein|nr:hypothetical protein [Bacilli bacterium]MDY0213992.1 hypothetical protein [Bacilli bacterium]
MSEIETVLTVISVIGALSTILFAYLAFKRANKKEDKLSGKNEGIIISDISYIKSSTERIEKRLDKLEVINTDTTTRVAVLERDVKSLSKAKYARKGN